MNRRALFRATAGAAASLIAAPMAAFAAYRGDASLVKLSRTSPPECDFKYRQCRHPNIVNRFEMNGYFTKESAAQLRAIVARDLKRLRFTA